MYNTLCVSVHSFTILGLKSCLTAFVSSSAYSAYRPVICKQQNSYRINQHVFFCLTNSHAVTEQLYTQPGEDSLSLP